MIKKCTNLYKNIYPVLDLKSTTGICFIGEVDHFKKLFGYLTVYQTAKKLKVKIDIDIMKIFELDNDPRFFVNGEFSKRKWNQMSLPFQMRATALIYYLAGYRRFSYPGYNRLHPNSELEELRYIPLWIKIKDFLAKNSTLLILDYE